MSEREHMSQERMEAVRNNLDSFKFCASWFHNLLDEAQRLSREATALRQQRDALRDALDRIANTSEGRDAAGHIARAALAQADAPEGV